MNIQIVSTRSFINKLTGNRFDLKNMARILAYLRAKGISFYDDFSQDHVSMLPVLESNKLIVLDALRTVKRPTPPNPPSPKGYQSFA